MVPLPTTKKALCNGVRKVLLITTFDWWPTCYSDWI